MLYIMIAYLMLFVCIMLNFLPLTFANAFCFHACLVWGYFHIVCLFQILFCIMHSAFYVGFPNFMFTPFFDERAMCSLDK